MTFIVQLALAFLVLTRTLGALPETWQSRLWRELESKPVSVSTVASQPVKTAKSQPVLGAAGYFAADAASGTTLLAKNPDKMRPIASITKLGTVLVILRTHQLGETVIVPEIPAYPPGAVTLGLKPGQRFRLSELVKAALIPSANDAADALAIWDSGSIKAFSGKANNLLRRWGISNIRLADANGLNPNSKASPRALEQLGELILTNPEVAKDVGTASTAIADESGRRYPLKSTNELLANHRFAGIKTGYTAESGQNLVALAKIKGHSVVSVVLNSPDRFSETMKLMNFIGANWSWR